MWPWFTRPIDRWLNRKLLAGLASVLQGVFVSKNGDAAGPWTLIADANKLCASGSGLAPCPSGYEPGVQAWYNQSLAVDPANDKHIVVGLEEVYQSFDAGNTFTTISSYWNYAFPCDATNTCPAVTHPDQHAVLMTKGSLFIPRTVSSTPPSSKSPLRCHAF